MFHLRIAKGPLDSHLGHQESAREAIGSELVRVKYGAFSLFNEFVDVRTLSADMMAEFVGTG